MDERTYCLTPEQWRHAKACLTLAKRWGLIGGAVRKDPCAGYLPGFHRCTDPRLV